MARNSRTATFRITRPGAQHWHPTEPGNPKSGLKQYVYNDLIELPYNAATDPKWNNLGLVLGGKDAVHDVAAEEAELGQEKANPAVTPAPGDIGDDKKKPAADNTGDDDKAKAAADEVAKVEALIAELEESNGNAEFQKAREKVVTADIFEEETIPTKKAELLQALVDYKDGLGGKE